MICLFTVLGQTARSRARRKTLPKTPPSGQTVVRVFTCYARKRKNIPGLKGGFPKSVQSSRLLFFAGACFFVGRRHRPWPKAHEPYPSAHGKKHCHFQAPAGACARRTVNYKSNPRSLTGVAASLIAQFIHKVLRTESPGVSKMMEIELI